MVALLNPTFSIIPAATIQTILAENAAQIFEIISATYQEHESQNTINPNSYFLRFPDKPNSRIIALPAALKANFSGIKWISSYPDNLAKDLPRASAVIILNDYETGYPLACLEGSHISASRTAYSAVLAAEHLHKPHKKIKRLGFIGTSFIAKNVLNAFTSLHWEIDQINLFDINVSAAESFAKPIKQPYEIHTTVESVLRESDLIVFATTALAPYISNQEDLAHNPTILNVSLRDLEPEILLASHNVVDDIDHVLNANTSPHLAYQKSGDRNFINGTLGQLLNSEISIDNDKPVIFSPMGLGILDIAIANFIYHKSLVMDSTINIKNFFQ